MALQLQSTDPGGKSAASFHLFELLSPSKAYQSDLAILELSGSRERADYHGTMFEAQ